MLSACPTEFASHCLALVAQAVSPAFGAVERLFQQPFRARKTLAGASMLMVFYFES
jgi:hypothetical protein